MINLPKKPLLKTGYKLSSNYEAIIFVFLVFEFYFLASKSTLPSESFVITHYLVSYEFGFAARGLVGAFFSILTDHVSINMIYLSAISAFFFLISLISLLLGRLIRACQPDDKSSIVTFVILFLASPLSVTYLLGFHFGRLDVYWIALTLLALIFVKNRILRWTVPLLCAAAILVHQGYMVTYMPGLAIPILYEVYKSKFSKAVIAIFSLSCLIMIALFLYLQFTPENFPFDNAVDYAQHLSKRASDFNAYPPMLQQEYFSSLTEWAQGIIFPILKQIALPLGITLLVFSIPLIIIFAYIWIKSILNANDKFLKFIFFICLVAPLIFIPAALTATDWDRWWAAAINNQFIILFYILYSGEITLSHIVKTIGGFFERHILLFLLIIAFTNSLTYSKSASIIFPLIMDPEGAGKLYLDFVNKTVYGVVRGG